MSTMPGKKVFAIVGAPNPKNFAVTKSEPEINFGFGFGSDPVI
jgi:hypothetical protein